MTPQQWYDKKRKEYKERYGSQWRHLYIWPPVGETQNLEVCETAARTGIECRALKANGSSEIEMVANAVMIKDYLAERRNSPYNAWQQND